MKKRAISDRPFVDNYPELANWLRERNARCMWQLPRGNVDDPVEYVECWLIGTRLAIVTVHRDRGGWDVYTSADTPKIDQTLEDADRRLGLLPR
jgi:hypothetical protein